MLQRIAVHYANSLILNSEIRFFISIKIFSVTSIMFSYKQWRWSKEFQVRGWNETRNLIGRQRNLQRTTSSIPFIRRIESCLNYSIKLNIFRNFHLTLWTSSGASFFFRPRMLEISHVIWCAFAVRFLTHFSISNLSDHFLLPDCPRSLKMIRWVTNANGFDFS